MIPDFGTPSGKRLVYRSVQVSQSSIAANGIPCTAPSQVWPPPYEMPQAPMWRSSTSGRAANWASSARRSAISRGPAIVTKPPESPWPRTS